MKSNGLRKEVLYIGLCIVVASLIISFAIAYPMSGSGSLDEKIAKGIENYVESQQRMAREQRVERERAIAKKAKAILIINAEEEHIFGNPDAKITLLEFSDLECPYCKQFHAVPKEMIEAFPEQLNWIFKHLPLEFHNPVALEQALASECVASLGGNEAFWKFTDIIFENTQSNGRGIPGGDLAAVAESVGVSKSAFIKCVEENLHKEDVGADMELAKNLGITGTPSIFLINNETGEIYFIPGALPPAQLKARIEELLR